MMHTWVLGNWKMHGSPEHTTRFAQALSDFLEQEADVLVQGVRLGVCPTHLHLMHASRCLPQAVLLGAQDAHPEAQGPFSGDVSAPMLKAGGAVFCLVGHSERRQGHGEDDALAGRKLQAVLQAGLMGVLCVGETPAQREAGKQADVVRRQLLAALEGLEEALLLPDSEEANGGLLVAYEPLWAIGTGQNASPAQASQMHQALRQVLTECLGQERGANIPLLYGGSVKPQNAGALLPAAEINGVLVGGASLEADSFWAIARHAAAVRQRS